MPKKKQKVKKKIDTLDWRKANAVPRNSAVGCLYRLRRGRGGVGERGRRGVELRRLNEGESLREGLGGIEERGRGWLRLRTLNDFLIGRYLYHYGAFPPSVWLRVLLLLLFLHFSSPLRLSQWKCAFRVTVRTFHAALGPGLAMGLSGLLHGNSPNSLSTGSLSFCSCSLGGPGELGRVVQFRWSIVRINISASYVSPKTCRCFNIRKFSLLILWKIAQIFLLIRIINLISFSSQTTNMHSIAQPPFKIYN